MNPNSDRTITSDPEMERQVSDAFSSPDDIDQTSLSIWFKVTNKPISDKQYADLLLKFESKLPAAYLAFFKESDGADGCAEGSDGEDLTLWSSSQICRENNTPVQMNDPVVIGTDGRGGFIGFDQSQNDDPNVWPVIRWSDRKTLTIADSFSQWQTRGFPLYPNGFDCVCYG